MQQDWNIKQRSEVCDATGRPFAEGEIFYTALFQDGEGFRRSDLCEDAWKALSANAAGSQPFSSWRSKFEPPAPPEPEALPRGDAEGMLRKLVESNDPSHTNTRYLLAIMLERKRILKPQPSSEKGTLVYEHSVTGEIFIIKDPGLSLSDLEAVQEEVSALLVGLSISSGVTPANTEPSASESAEAA